MNRWFARAPSSDYYCPLVPLISRIPSIDSVHYQPEVFGKLNPLRKLTPREKLSGWRTLPERTIESFFMHKVTCTQLLSLTPGKRRTPIEVKKPGKKPAPEAVKSDFRAKLNEVDELTLALHLHLCFNQR